MSNTTKRGIWIATDDFRSRFDALALGDSARVTVYLPRDVVQKGRAYIAVVSRSEDSIEYLALARVGSSSGDLERKTTLGPFVPVALSAPLNEVLAGVPGPLRPHVRPPARRAVSVPPASFDALLNRLVACNAVSADRVDLLKELVRTHGKKNRVTLLEAVAFERDAVAVALNAFGGSAARQRVLNSVPIQADAPFIESLRRGPVRALEDQMIQNDLTQLLGAEVVQRFIIGAVQVESEHGSLTIVNANRTPIERTLGVDLVYYHHTYRSFTLVQYKRLTGTGRRAYRPSADASYGEEIARMKSLRCSERGDAIIDFRMLARPFYFKLCDAQQDHFMSRMLPGMYIPLDLWDILMASPTVKGPKGGVAVSFESAGRYMSNSEFSQLLRAGWIGTHVADEPQLSAILQSSLASGHSVLAAVHKKQPSPDSSLRDQRGRYASDEDWDGG